MAEVLVRQESSTTIPMPVLSIGVARPPGPRRSRGHARSVDREKGALLDVLIANRPMLVNLARGFVGCASLAEDVVHDVFIKLVDFPDQEAVRQPVAYVTRMVRNASIDAFRRQSLENTYHADEDDGLHVPSPEPSPEAALLVRDGSITRLVTSPARRAAQTTSVLKGAFDLAGRPLVRTEDARLVEIDMGAWAGLTHAEVAASWPDASAAIARGDDVRRGDGGETLAEATARVEAGVRDAVSSATPGESVLVVTHGAVIRGVTGALAGLTPQTVRTSFRSIDNCHWVTLVERRDDGRAEAQRLLDHVLAAHAQLGEQLVVVGTGGGGGAHACWLLSVSVWEAGEEEPERLKKALTGSLRSLRLRRASSLPLMSVLVIFKNATAKTKT